MVTSQADSYVSKEAFLFDSKVKQGKRKNKMTRTHYAIGANLLKFLEERDLISVSDNLSFTQLLPGVKKKRKGYIPKSCYAM